MARIIGSHTVPNGGIHMAALRAGNAGLESMQLFTAIPKFYGDKASIKPDRIARFHEALAQTPMKLENIVVHAAYVLSVATAEADKWSRATAGLAKEMERSTQLGVGSVCFHPGSASDGNPKAAAERVARAMTAALEHVPGGETRLLVENTAGAGRTLGRTAAEVGDILAGIPASLRPRAGYGLDTCHLYSSGYDIAESRERFSAILDEFVEATGEKPSFFHLNDSEGALGSNRDRHMLLGRGCIGVEPFRWLIEDERSAGVPLVLETPQLNNDIAGDDATPDPWDIEMLALLRSLGA